MKGLAICLVSIATTFFNSPLLFAGSFDLLQRIEGEPTPLVSPGDDKDESSYSVLTLTDKKTGVQLLDDVPTITRDAVETMRMYNRYDSPIRYSYEKLAPDWRKTDKRFTDSALETLVKTEYDPNPFNVLLKKTHAPSKEALDPTSSTPASAVSASDMKAELEWVQTVLEADTRKFYDHSVNHSLNNHLNFGSAAHYGFVHNHFEFPKYAHPYEFYKFVKLVGPSPKDGDLPKIASFQSEALKENRPIYKQGYSQTAAKAMITYVATLLSQPPFEVAKSFEKVDPQFYLTQAEAQSEQYLAAHFLGLAGNVYAEKGEYEKADQLYIRALKITDSDCQKGALTQLREDLKSYYEKNGTSALFEFVPASGTCYIRKKKH